jgi:hypothetical protein
MSLYYLITRSATGRFGSLADSLAQFWPMAAYGRFADVAAEQFWARRSERLLFLIPVIRLAWIPRF